MARRRTARALNSAVPRDHTPSSHSARSDSGSNQNSRDMEKFSTQTGDRQGLSERADKGYRFMVLHKLLFKK